MIRSTMAAGTVAVLLFMAGAAAQSPVDRTSSDIGDAPVTIDGWRYIKGPNDLHVYLCDHAECVRGSRVILRFFPSNTAIMPGQFRRDEAIASEMLQEHPKPGTTFSGTLDTSRWRERDVATAPDGTKKYSTSFIVSGSKLWASLTSWSSDETASEANYEQFEMAIKAATDPDLRAKPQ